MMLQTQGKHMYDQEQRTMGHGPDFQAENLVTTENSPIMKIITHKPWGNESIIKKTDKYVVKELYVKQNSSLSLQYHKRKIETLFLVDGKGFLETSIEDDWSCQQMHYMFPYYVQPGLIHRLYTKNSDCLVVEISSTQLDDVVRLKDRYGRV